jgi:hypothetical protein
MMIANAIEIEGTLQADGLLILDEKPAMPPGRVRVALRALVERLPDAPWADDGVPAPFDLPREGAVVRVQARSVPERLPEIPTGLAEEAG